MHCTILICLIYLLDHIHAEPKSEIQVEQIRRSVVVRKHQVLMILTFALNQGKPRYI
jgi:hypothetical protein